MATEKIDTILFEYCNEEQVDAIWERYGEELFEMINRQLSMIAQAELA